MAERILLLSEPQKARLSSIRASALALCSYIEGLTGSGATATVKTRSACATARLRVGVSPGKRVIIGNLRLASINMLGDDRKIIVSRSGIDRFLQHGADQLRAADFQSGLGRELQRVGQILQRILGRERALRKIPRHDRLHAVIAQRKTIRRAL